MDATRNVPAPTRRDLDELTTWFSRESALFPEKIRETLACFIAMYSGVFRSAARARQTLTQLRQAMGFIPKSEKSRQLPEPPPEPELLPEPGPEYEATRKKRDELARQVRRCNRKLRELRPRPRPSHVQLEFDLGKPAEMLFSSPCAERDAQARVRQVNRMQEFGKESGFHVTHDYPRRMELKVVATEITYKVETVTDPVTGKSVRASMVDDGPEGFQVTWGTVANLIKMHVGFAIPIHRIVLMIGQPEFSSGKICRILQYAAAHLMDVYLALADQLSDVAFLAGDDTPTKVLDAEDRGADDPLCEAIDARLGWAQPRADGRGQKKALNVSLVVGRSKGDPRSTIRFFRTHRGSVGNLLTKVLEARSPKVGPVVFQGDLSSANLPTPEIRAKTLLALAGCASHARRPFWRHREDDQSLCYFMLRGFLMLSGVEAKIDERGRTRANVLKLRGRYGRMIWLALKNRCQIAVTGEPQGPATYPKGIAPNIWPPGSELHRAAMYVINHFEELTLYLKHPELEPTNNGSERGLRIEKCMLDASKFRKTKRGRVTLDILRTINATCTAAGVELTDYLRFVIKHADQVHERPEEFTPFAFARTLGPSQTTATAVAHTMPLA